MKNTHKTDGQVHTANPRLKLKLDIPLLYTLQAGDINNVFV